MSDYEDKRIEDITEEDREMDRNRQNNLALRFFNGTYDDPIISLFQRIDPNVSMTNQMFSIFTFALNPISEVSCMQISAPYKGTYQRRFFSGMNYSYRRYNKIKNNIIERGAELVWEGKMNNPKFS